MTAVGSGLALSAKPKFLLMSTAVFRGETIPVAVGTVRVRPNFVLPTVLRSGAGGFFCRPYGRDNDTSAVTLRDCPDVAKAMDVEKDISEFNLGIMSHNEGLSPESSWNTARWQSTSCTRSLLVTLAKLYWTSRKGRACSSSSIASQSGCQTMSSYGASP